MMQGTPTSSVGSRISGREAAAVLLVITSVDKGHGVAPASTTVLLLLVPVAGVADVRSLLESMAALWRRRERGRRRVR